MKYWYKLFLFGLIFVCFSIKATAGSGAKDFALNFNKNTHRHNAFTRQGVSDGLTYIKRYSSLSPQSEYKHTMVSGTLLAYDRQLMEINNRSNVKVYILLINGLTHPHHNTLPEQASNVSQIFNWSDNQKGLDQYSYRDVGTEAKEIIGRIASSESQYIKEPVIFCSLIQFDVKHGSEKGKKITLYHTSIHGSGVDEGYRSSLEQYVKNTSWTNNAEQNLSSLVSIIRQVAQGNITNELNADEVKSLWEKLMATHQRSKINRAIDTLHHDHLLAFDHDVRAHVVAVLFGPSDLPPPPNSGMAMVDPSIPRNALSVLENIPDNKIKPWLDHINTKKVRNETLLQKIIGSLNDGFLSDDNYTKFFTLLNRQLRLDPDFHEKSQRLFTDEDKLSQFIVWDKSYFLNLFTTSPIGTNKYEVDLQTDGKLKLRRSTVKDYECYVEDYGGKSHITPQYICNPVWKSESPQYLDPFDVVAFIDRSDLSLFTSSGSGGDNIMVVPAIHLLYAKQKEWNKNVGKGISLGIDLVTIAMPISKLKYGPQLARRIIYGVEMGDKVSAMASLSINLGLEGERYNEIVSAYSNIQMVLSLSTMGYKATTGEIRKMADYVRVVREYEEELVVVAKQNATVEHALNVANKIDHEASVLIGPQWVRQHTTSLSNVGTLAGQATKSRTNLLEIEAPVRQFRQLQGPSRKIYRAADFWKSTADDFIHFISEDAKYYIKHDPATGRMLFLQIDCEPKRFLGYLLDQDKLIKGNYSQLLDNLKTIHGLPGGSTVLNLSAGTVQLSPHKANLLLGKYQPNNIPGISNEIGTDDVINELTLLKNYSFADNGFALRPGSVHVLNIPDGNVKDWNTFFQDFNKNFLDMAIKNSKQVGIIFVTDPRKVDLLDTYDRTAGVFTGKPSGFGKEVRYLRDRGITIVKLKDGTSVNLATINLDNLDWSGWNY